MRSKTTTSGLAAFAFIALVTLQPLVVAQPCEAKQKMDAAHSEHPVTEEIHGGKTFNVSHALIKAKPDDVWHVLTDYNNASRVFPMMKKCQVLEDKGSTKLMKHVIAPTGSICNYEYIIALKETAKRALEWKRVSGSFKEVDGFWRLEAVDGGRHTHVTYATHVNGGMFIPQGLIKRQFRIDMPEVMTLLTHRVEGSTQIAARRDSSSQSQ
ncbi:MAG: SRPBCC family protein [Leptolyngbya sp.]|nr:SRPBCC family protein [Candidatus Melainabacteria bacterium]